MENINIMSPGPSKNSFRFLLGFCTEIAIDSNCHSVDFKCLPQTHVLKAWFLIKQCSKVGLLGGVLNHEGSEPIHRLIHLGIHYPVDLIGEGNLKNMV